jgi:hypothetical protein
MKSVKNQFFKTNQEKVEEPTLFNNALIAGSLNMLSVKIDKAF